MEIVYSLGGRPFKVDADRIWSKSGQYVGKVVEGRVFSPSGKYLGEFRDDRLAYKRSNASKTRMGHIARSNRSGTSRGNRAARTVPAGWEEFHG
jgi:hypothetical protein